MAVKEAINVLWKAIRQGEHFPEALQGKLSLEDAYRVQEGILARHIANGDTHTGWKVAMSGPALRQARGLTEPVFGYLLHSGHFTSGQTLPYDTFRNPAIESELCITVGRRLQGPGVTRAQVLDAVTQIAPAFELVSMRSNMAADLPLGVADNIAQWGYVTGKPVRPYPKNLALAEVLATIHRNDQVEGQVRSADILDDQLDSIAWLANALGRFGRAIEADHAVLTGSFNRPTAINKGDRWCTQFREVGTVTARFV